MNARWVMLAALSLGMVPGSAPGEDWPQWRGPNRDARVAGFTPPQMWPKDLTKKWSIPIGEGVSTPALVGDKLYTFSRQEGKEITRCLEAGTGKEIWKDEYASAGATGGAAQFSGPRSSPAVAEGKVVTLGVRGMLSCFDAASGKKLWRKEDYANASPMSYGFYVASSPILINGLCIAQLGGQSDAVLVAYDLTGGAEKWKWKGDGIAYASPVLLALGDTKIVVAETNQQIVGVNVADGKLLWKTPYSGGGGGKGGPPGGGKGGPPGGGKGMGGGMRYNASTPMVDGQTLIYSGSGRGTKAVQLEKKGDEIVAKEIWNNTENSVKFNTPVLKDGMVFGLTERNELFCITKDGKTAWTSAIKGQGGHGSIVDAGSVLLSLTPAGQLVVFEPSAKGYKDLATFKVSDSATHAYPVVSGNRVFIKDKDAVTLYTIE